jgi:hypothetical protein
MYSPQDTAEAVGFPIRTSMDQSLFAAPHGFSQRTTSFIASQRQGIHQMPLSRLIALISQCPEIPTTLHGTKSAPTRVGQLSLVFGITGIGKTSCKDLPLHPFHQMMGPGRRAVRRALPCPGRRATARPPCHGTESQIPSSQCQRSHHQPRSGRQILSRPGVVQPQAPIVPKTNGNMLPALESFAVRTAPGGARRDRTDDLLLAKQALSQLSYGPVREQSSDVSRQDVLITDD